MRLMLAAIGRLKDGAERDLSSRYAELLKAAGRSQSLGPVTIVELNESRAATAVLRRQDEAERLVVSVAGAEVLVALDEHGKAQSSADFAHWIAGRRDAGVRSMAFVVGGPDGQGEAVLAKAALKLSLGAMTLPHGLARIVLAEQLYRAATILSGHPYHRS